MGDTSQETDLQALERFVVDNDELLELEARIGRFNIFDALGIVNNEIRHSNFLAWLLDPGESHGLGPLFLNAVLMDLLRQTPAKDRLFSPIKLDGGELRGVQVRREWNHIDLLITCDDPSFVIAIENKIYSSEHSGQLGRYKKIVNDTPELSKREHRQFVYLTREGDEPSEDEWTIYSYADLHRVLTKVRKTSGDQMGDDVRAFLDHYLRMIGSRFMDDEKIDELCKAIYTNHRQAIDLIIERVGAGRSALTRAMQELVESQADRWYVTNQTARDISFMPITWKELLPPIGARPRMDPRSWLSWSLWCHNGQCTLRLVCNSVTDDSLRVRCIECLTSVPDFKIRKRKRPLSRGWNSLGLVNISKWPEENEPDADDLAIDVRKALDQAWLRLQRAPEVMRPIIEQWQNEQAAGK